MQLTYDVMVVYMDPDTVRIQSETIKADTIQAAKGIVDKYYYNNVYGLGFCIKSSDGLTLDRGGVASEDSN